MRSDDLAPLLGPSGPPDLGYRQGTVVSWNEVTGSNTVNVGGAILSDVPVLNLGEFTLLAPGDVVGLLRYKTSYFIVGRMIPPSAPDRNRATMDFAAVGASLQNFGINVGAGNLRATGTVVVPSWADSALIHATVNMSYENNYNGVAQNFFICASIDGVVGGEMFEQTAYHGFGQVSASAIRTMLRSDGTLPNSFVIGCRIRCDTGGSLASVSNICNTDASIIFRRTN